MVLSVTRITFFFAVAFLHFLVSQPKKSKEVDGACLLKDALLECRTKRMLYWLLLVKGCLLSQPKKGRKSTNALYYRNAPSWSVAPTNANRNELLKGTVFFVCGAHLSCPDGTFGHKDHFFDYLHYLTV